MNFIFSNTVFIHSHTTDDGHTVTHSHPYLPSSHHSHSSQSLSLVSLLNLSAASVEAAGHTPVPSAPVLYNSIFNTCIAEISAARIPGLDLRGPPAVR